MAVVSPLPITPNDGQPPPLPFASQSVSTHHNPVQKLCHLVQEAHQHVSEENLSLLHDKLTKIEQGLMEIEIEHDALCDQSSKLHQDQQLIVKELDNREKEISSLSRRCASQNDRMKDVAKLQGINKDLGKQVHDLKMALSSSDQTQHELDATRRDVKQLRLDRHELLERLASIKRDHDAVADNLQICLTKMERLTREKEEWEEERSRLVRRMELDLDQQRLEHKQDTLELKEMVKGKEDMIQKLRQALAEVTVERAQLLENVLELEQRHELTLANCQWEERQALEQLSQSMSKELEAVKCQHENEMARVQSELSHCTSMVSVLQTDLSGTMEKLMSASVAVQKAAEESALFESLTSDIEALEHERYNLQDKLHHRDTEIAELSATVMKLEIERRLQCEQDSGDRVEQVGQLKLASAQNLVRRLEQDVKEAREDQRQAILRLKAEHDKVVESLKAQVAGNQTEIKALVHETKTRDSTIRSLEDSLLQKEAKLLSMQEQSRVSCEQLELKHSLLKTEHDKEVSMLKSSIGQLESAFKSMVSSHAKELLSKDRSIASLKQSLKSAASDFSEAHQEQISGILQELRYVKDALDKKEGELREITFSRVPDLETQLAGSTADLNGLKEQLKCREAEAAATRADFMEQVSRLRMQLGDRDARDAERSRNSQGAMNEVNTKMGDLTRERDAMELELRKNERQLKEARADATILVQRVSSLEQTDLDLRKETLELQRAARDAREECRRLVDVLRVETEGRAAAESAAAKAEESFACARHRLESVETMLLSKDSQLCELEDALRDTTERLNNTLLDKNSLEQKVVEKDSCLASIDRLITELNLQIADKYGELEQLRGEWARKEDCYLDELNRERTEREIAEADLVEIKTNLDLATRQCKGALELVKENEQLKDKVRRQEAYLKRKLDKDKAIKDRTGTSMKTLARTTRSSSVLRSGESRATLSTVSSGSSAAEWELADLELLQR